MSDWYRIEVSDHAGQIVAIESEMLAGRDIGDAERKTVFRALESLSSFIGACAHGRDPKDCIFCDNAPTASDFL